MDIRKGVVKRYKGISEYVAVSYCVNTIENYAFSSNDNLVVYIPDSKLTKNTRAFDPRDKLVIECKKESVAERYCRKNKINFSIIN